MNFWRIRIGNWMLTKRGLFHYRLHRAAKSKSKEMWYQWDRVL